MEPVVTAEVMRAADKAAILGGTDERELILRAATALRQAYGYKGPVAVVAGPGNNGADGLVLARLLARDGIPVELFLLEESGAPGWKPLMKEALAAGVPLRYLDAETSFDSFSEIVDCLFGTGFHGELSGLAKAVVEAIDRARGGGAFVVSADIPSGLSGTTGLGGTAVKADLTVAIQFYKTGLFLNRAKDHTGCVVVCDIGIPLTGEATFLPDEADFRAVLRPRGHYAHKGTYGYVTMIGGCAAYSGAVKLAAMSQAALRAGAGVSRLAIPASIAPAVAPYVLEATLCPMPDEGGFMCYDEDALSAAVRGAAAVAVGMGWGRGRDNEAILRFLLTHLSVPLLIDADGINTLAAMGTDVLREAHCPVVLTPHPLDFQRLSGVPATEAAADPVRHARDFAGKYGVTLLLKGTTTVVSDGKETMLVSRGCPGMATAGSGDVLSGILVGLLGWNEPTVLTVACGAYIAGLAGEIAERDTNPISMTAGDTARHVADAVSKMLR